MECVCGSLITAFERGDSSQHLTRRLDMKHCALSPLLSRFTTRLQARDCRAVPGCNWWLFGRRLFGALGLLSLCLGLLMAMTVERQPSLPLHPETEATPGSVSSSLRGKLGIGTRVNSEKRFVLNADDLKAAMHLLMARKHLQGDSRFLIENNRLRGQVSLRLPIVQAHWYLNLDIETIDQEGGAHLEKLRIGHLAFSSPMAGWVVRGLMHLPQFSRYRELVTPLLHEVRIMEGRLVAMVRWNREILGQLRGVMPLPADRERLPLYRQRLVEVLSDGTQSRYVRLVRLTQPLFALAHERSQLNRQPIEENRAVLLTLSDYATGKDWETPDGEPIVPHRKVLLNKRIDTAQHFLGAAVMALSGQGALVEMIGLAKELHDTHDGSGFSFIDLAADQAGAMLGRYAVRSPEMASHIQTILRQNGTDDGLLIPQLMDLPESMDSQTFAARFKNIDSPEYQAMKQEIDSRIRNLPLYRIQ